MSANKSGGGAGSQQLRPLRSRLRDSSRLRTYWGDCSEELERSAINSTVVGSILCSPEVVDGDVGVQVVLRDDRMLPLLPPVGAEVFRRFTPASLEEIQRRREVVEKEQQKRKEKNIEIGDEDLPKPASDLEAGKPLPFIYGDPPPELLNTPLEELDPFYQSQKTFIVITKGNIIYRFNAEPACYLLSPFSHLRIVAIKILIHSYPF
ncbi:Sodium channel protein type 4 subunit alpha B Voltage-gated sodium channel subunit alpha Nav1.4b [Channa argus]|uniref:Sodium channel protein type 4 subunit alpha B Voltage-gated sodium channel subunit alpha Nav1.4b n=1 Tax=Channa argus TaxID=215402 RepID=A0A6G1QDM9_CHAAH|nr:Sodium channel protein type 4 subunit alpha B Voltage-gated sodium channel subunit alpha Nav1.4b [Channa argus]